MTPSMSPARGSVQSKVHSHNSFRAITTRRRTPLSTWSASATRKWLWAGAQPCQRTSPRLTLKLSPKTNQSSSTKTIVMQMTTTSIDSPRDTYRRGRSLRVLPSGSSCAVPHRTSKKSRSWVSPKRCDAVAIITCTSQFNSWLEIKLLWSRRKAFWGASRCHPEAFPAVSIVGCSRRRPPIWSNYLVLLGRNWDMKGSRRTSPRASRRTRVWQLQEEVVP